MKGSKDTNDLVNSALQKKVKIPVLFKMEELERIKDNMKKKNVTHTFTTTPKKLLTPISPSSLSLSTKKIVPSSLSLSTKKVRSLNSSTPGSFSARKRVQQDFPVYSSIPFKTTPSSTKKKKEIVLQQKDDSCSLSSAPNFSTKTKDQSETFRKAFITEIKKVEALVEEKFKNLKDSKDKEVSCLQKDKESLQEALESSNDENAKAAKRLEDLKSLIIPLKNQLECQCRKVKELRQLKEALEKKSADLQVENERLEKELSEERGNGYKDKISTLLTEISVNEKKVDDLSSEKEILSNSVEEKSLHLSTLKEENKNILKDAQAKVDELSSLYRSSEEKAERELKRQDQILIDVKTEAKKKVDDLEEKVRSLQTLLDSKNNHTEASSSKRKKDENFQSRKRRRTKKTSYQELSEPGTGTGSALSLVDSFTAALSTARKEGKQKPPSLSPPLPKINWSVENGKVISSSPSIRGSGIHQNRMNSSRIMEELFGDDADVTEAADENDETINTTLDHSTDSSSLSNVTYSPAKTSSVSQSSSPVIRIRNIEELLHEDNNADQTQSFVQRVNLEEKDEIEDKHFAEKHLLLMKDAISKDVEKCLTKFLENKSISSKKEFMHLANLLSNYFAEKIKEKHLMINRSTKDISLSNIEKREFIDQTILFFNIKIFVSKTLQPCERKVKPDILNNIKAEFTKKFFFQTCDPKMLIAKENWRAVLTEDNQRHIKDYLNFFMNTQGYV